MGEPTPPVSAGEERVAIESEHLAAIVRSSDDAILSKDRKAIIKSWNDGAERMYGWTADEAIGQSVAIIIPPERQGEELEIVRKIVAGERLEHYETERVRKDGVRIPVSLTASPIHAADGEVVGVSTQARDLSPTHRRLESAEQRFLSAFEDAPIGMSIFSAAPASFGALHQANVEMTRLFGYTEEELKVLEAGALTHPDDAPLERTLLDELRDGKRTSYALEKRNRHKDGRWVWVSTTVSLLEGDSERLALAHVLDITDRKEGEKALYAARANLERSNTELDQFAYVASHDLKEPLILLSAYARMLTERHGEELDEEGRTFLGHIRDEAGRMKAMIDDLLDYSRLESRGEETEDVYLGAALETALERLAPRLEEADADVEVEGTFPTVRGSASQFERLFRNLISNAVKFRGERPPVVTIAGEQRDREWVFEVRDNGIGVDPLQADRVFDVFHRLHSQERYAGTGMGLAISKRVVERHGGRIWVEPAPDGGSIFKFTVPG